MNHRCNYKHREIIAVRESTRRLHSILVTGDGQPIPLTVAECRIECGCGQRFTQDILFAEDRND